MTIQSQKALKWMVWPNHRTVDDHDAQHAFDLAVDMLDFLDEFCVTHYAIVGPGRYAFRLPSTGLLAFVEIEHDADVSGDRYVDRSTCVRITFEGDHFGPLPSTSRS